MNIFILDRDPLVSAQYHADKHCGKMILESAQMLSTVLGGPYRPTHQKHPCTLWVAKSRQNAVWLCTLAMGLNAEWRDRYGHTRNHKSWEVIAPLWEKTYTLPDEGLTPFILAMPDEYKTDDPVESYRAYYRSKPFVAWERGPTPDWY